MVSSVIYSTAHIGSREVLNKEGVPFADFPNVKVQQQEFSGDGLSKYGLSDAANVTSVAILSLGMSNAHFSLSLYHNSCEIWMYLITSFTLRNKLGLTPDLQHSFPMLWVIKRLHFQHVMDEQLHMCLCLLIHRATIKCLLMFSMIFLYACLNYILSQRIYTFNKGKTTLDFYDLLLDELCF